MSTQDNSHFAADNIPSLTEDSAHQNYSDEVAFIQSLDLTAAEMTDASDDGDILDLTDELPTDDPQGNDQTRSSNSNIDSEALEFFREAGLSDEMLRSYGIDLEEIRAQCRLQKQAQQDFEYARRIQEQLNSEASASASISSILAPPQSSFSHPQQTDMHPQQNTSFSQLQQPSTELSQQTTTLPSFDFPFVRPASTEQQHSLGDTNQLEDRSPKRLKADKNDTIDLMQNQLQRAGIQATRITSSASASASGSSSGNNNNNNNSSSSKRNSDNNPIVAPILIDDDDEDNVIDLTDDSYIGPSSPSTGWNGFDVNLYASSLSEPTTWEGFDASRYASSSRAWSSSVARPNGLPYTPYYSTSSRNHERSYNDYDPDADIFFDDSQESLRSMLGQMSAFESMVHGTLNSSRSRAPTFYTPYYMTPSVGSSRRNYSRLDLPYGQYESESSQALTEGQTERELKQLLESIQYEDSGTPEDRVGTPDGLAIALMEHQKVGLQWMTRQEESVNKGGILSDDMGLGKTIQAMAIIVSRPHQNPTPLSHLPLIRKRYHDDPSQKIKLKATLVVCPVSLIAQWEREIVTKTRPSLKVYVHHGPSRKSDPTELIDFDVVITAFTTLSSDLQEVEDRRGPLSKVTFHRVILDEAHTIKNRRTRAAEACCRLDAEYRWCLTATPIQNKIEELYSLIRFLRIRPYCEWEEFRDEIDKPMKKGKHTHALKKVQVLLKAISLRRSKKARIDGKPILQLPERNVNFTHVDFSPDERHFYDYVNANAQERFNRYVEAGTVMKNYSSVLVLLLRLRQACLHPSLTMMEVPNEDGSNEDRSSIAKTMDKRVVGRLLESNDLKEIECPICMDMADQAQIIANCGHILCRECLTNYINTGDGVEKRCPHCRGPLDRKKVVPVETFLLVHAPKIYEEVVGAPPEEKKEEEVKPEKKFLSSSKIDKMLEILEETRRTTDNKDKTIIFSQFTSMLDIIEKPLRQHEFKYARFDGTMSVAKREMSLVKFFTDPNVTVLLVSTKCGSLGLNLTVANRVILMDIWWNPALENQAIDRVHRIGQKKPVDVHRIFVNDTVEDRILQLQKKKQALIDGSLGEGNATKVGRLGVQELLHLFRGTGLTDYDDDSRV